MRTRPLAHPRARALTLALAFAALLALGGAACSDGAPATACGVAAAATAPPPAAVREALSAPQMLRVDQVGYVADCPKLAWLMSMRALHAPRFALAGPARLQGRAGPGRRFGRWHLYPLRFDALQTPGRYRLTAAGARAVTVGIGAAPALYRPIAGAALSFLQEQRDGPNVIPGPLHRLPSHLADANATVYGIPHYRGLTLVGGLVPTGVHVDASGGWFDAGDYLKFVETASFTDALLLYTLREDPAGVPDPAALAAEARYGTDWLMRMWDQQHRVLYFQVGIGDGNGHSILGDHDLWRLPQADDRAHPRPGSPAYFAINRPVFAANAPGGPISPNLAGRVAAAFGLCAQDFAASDPAYAQQCLTDGETIYAQADTAPRGRLLTSVPFDYYTETEWKDDLEFGAIELYLGSIALGGAPSAQYLSDAGTWADAYASERGGGTDSLNLYDVSTLADADLIPVLESPAAAAIEAQPGVNIPTDAPSLLKDRGQQLALAVRLARRDPFGLANPSTNVDTVTHALGYAIQAHSYDRLTSTSAQQGLEAEQLGWVFGANAWGSSFVVGAGSVFPHCLAGPLANLSGALDGRGAIDVGATVNGPTDAAGIRGLGAPSGFRACPRGPDRFAAVSDASLHYLDDVRSPDTSEPTDDGAALLLLAAAEAG